MIVWKLHSSNITQSHLLSDIKGYQGKVQAKAQTSSASSVALPVQLCDLSDHILLEIYTMKNMLHSVFEKSNRRTTRYTPRGLVKVMLCMTEKYSSFQIQLLASYWALVDMIQNIRYWKHIRPELPSWAMFSQSCYAIELSSFNTNLYEGSIFRSRHEQNKRS